MRRIIAFISAVLLLAIHMDGRNRAFTVFIGEYPEDSGWSRTAAENDMEIILEMLHSNGFADNEITVLKDEQATFNAIVDGLDSISVVTRPGDGVYIHFSCHGQRITDQDGDERFSNPADRYDEAIVPYDASIAYNWHGYKGERHLTDDILYEKVRKIYDAAGPNGTVLVVADACHSGDLMREEDGDIKDSARGAIDNFEQPYRGVAEPVRQGSVDWPFISACKDFQSNFEVKVDGVKYGRLSYALSRCFHSAMTAPELYDALSEQYRTLPLPKGRLQSLIFHIPDNYRRKHLFKK